MGPPRHINNLSAVLDSKPFRQKRTARALQQTFTSILCALVEAELLAPLAVPQGPITKTIKRGTWAYFRVTLRMNYGAHPTLNIRMQRVSPLPHRSRASRMSATL